MEINKEIFQKAIEKWGQGAQYEMIIEECLELATILQKAKRKQRKIDPIKVAEEIADVIIMVEQAKLMFGEQLIAMKIAEKLDRLEKRLNED